MRMLLVCALAVTISTAARAADTKAPVIVHTPPAGAEGDVVAVLARITDESKFFPQVFYRYESSGEYKTPLDMKPVKGEPHMYGANVPVEGHKSVEYYIEAYDEFGNGPGRSGEPERPHRVRLGAPEAPKVTQAEKPAEKTPDSAWGTPAPQPQPQPQPQTHKAPSGATARAQASAEPKRMWTWIAGGVGVGMLAGGLMAGLAAKTAGDAYNDRLKDPQNNPVTLKSQYDAAQGMGSKATILTITGLVFVAGATALYFYEPGFYSSSGVSMAAGPVDGGAAVAMAGRF